MGYYDQEFEVHNKIKLQDWDADDLEITLYVKFPFPDTGMGLAGHSPDLSLADERKIKEKLRELLEESDLVEYFLQLCYDRRETYYENEIKDLTEQLRELREKKEDLDAHKET